MVTSDNAITFKSNFVTRVTQSSRSNYRPDKMGSRTGIVIDVNTNWFM